LGELYLSQAKQPTSYQFSLPPFRLLLIHAGCPFFPPSWAGIIDELEQSSAIKRKNSGSLDRLYSQCNNRPDVFEYDFTRNGHLQDKTGKCYWQGVEGRTCLNWNRCGELLSTELYRKRLEPRVCQRYRCVDIFRWEREC
jgi:hypothetical protein